MKFNFIKRNIERNKEKINSFISFLFFVSFIFSPFLPIIPVRSAEAVFNKQINYQGKLTTSTGVAVANGTYNMEFKLYDALTGGTTLWTETRVGGDKVPVANGLFSVMLGEVNSLSGVDFNQTLYLGVRIESDGEMAPRKKLGAVPASVFSENAINTAITEDIATASAVFPTWVSANIGNLPQKTTSTKLSFIPSTGILTSTGFAGSGAGLTGTASSLNAGTVTNGVYTNASNSFSLINPLTTLAESWIGPSSTAGIYFKGGNVGIGTTNPAYNLEVTGTGYFSGALKIGGYTMPSTDGSPSYFLQTNGAGTASWQPVAASQVFKGTWDASTNTPTLADGTGTSGWYYRITTGGTQDLGSGSITFSVGDDVSYNGSIWQRIPANSNFATRALDNLTSVAINTDLVGAVTGGMGVRGGILANDDLILEGTTNSTRTSSYVILQPNGGNVGIGTTTPAGILDVRPAAALSGAGSSIILKAQKGAAGEVGGNLLFSSGDNGAGNYNGYIAFGIGAPITGNAFTAEEKMRIDISGNVGIGTTTPSTFKLEVAGNVGPEADNTRDLGSSGKRWANVYATNFVGAITPSGFTQGSAIFAGVGGTLAQDNANFFWDDTNNRLGIGTATPQYKLSLGGTDDAIGFYSSATAYSSIKFYDSTNGAMVFDNRNPSSGGYSFRSATTPILELSKTTFDVSIPNGKLTVSGTGNTTIAGNVGIGTTAPVDKLTVNGITSFHYGNTSGYGNNAVIGNISAYSTSVAPTTGVTAAEIRFLTGTNSYAKGQIAFFTNGVDSTSTAPTEKMRIDNNGNVGIGTTAPGVYKLNVNGDTYGGGEVIAANSLRTEQGIAHIGVYGGSNTASIINMFTAAEAVYKNWSIQANGTVNGAFTITPSSIIGGNGFTDPALTILQGGNVGIGTTSPTGNLVVSGGSGHTRFFIQNDATGYTTGDGLQMLMHSNGVDSYISNTENGYLSLSTNNSEAMRINNLGNVGIGTTTPTTFKLEVAGNVGPEADNTRDLGSSGRRWANVYATNFVGAITPTGFTLGSAIFAGAGGTLTQDNANFFWDDTNNRLGVGTAVPSTILDVQAAAATAQIKSTTGTNSAWLRFNNTGGNFYIGSEGSVTGGIAVGSTPYAGVISTGGAYPLQLGVGNAIAMTVLPTSGNVGIGTTGPLYKLDVNGTIRTGSSNDVGTINFGTGDQAIISTEAGNIFRIKNWGTGGVYHDVFYANAAGNVGIGTTTPSSLLHLASPNGTDVPRGDIIMSRYLVASAERGSSLFHYRNSSPGNDMLVFGVTGDINGSAYDLGLPNQISKARMVIQANGNVGIGNTTPGAKLDVTGNIQSTVSGGSNLFLVKSSGASISFQDGTYQNSMIESGSSSNANRLEFWTNTATNTGLVERMRIDNAGNVGIGTTNLYAGTNVTALTINASNYPAISFQTGGTGNNGTVGYSWPNTYLQSNNGTNVALLTASGNLTLLDNGNVGIGTTTPTTFKLEVAGNVGPEADNTRDLGSSGKKWANVYATNFVGAITPSGFTQGSAIFAGVGGTLAQDNANFFWDNSNKRLGIGTAGPAATIDVRGASGVTTLADFWGSAMSQPFSILAGNAVEQQYKRGSFIGQNIALDATTGLPLNRLGTYVASAIGFAPYTGGGNSGIGFFVTPSTTANTVLTEAMRIDKNGNVGIGTTGPQEKLTLGGNQLFALAPNVGSYGTLEAAYNGNIATYGVAANIDFYRPVATSGNEAEIRFSTNPGGVGVGSLTQRMVIDRLGNVGIGTTAPNVRLGQKLDVASSANYGGANLSTWSATASQASALDFSRSKSATIGTQSIVANGDALGYMTFRGSDGSNFQDSAAIQSFVDNVPGASDMPGRLVFLTTQDGSASLSERMRIDSAGNVGIGTTGPEGKLHVVGITPGMPAVSGTAQTGLISRFQGNGTNGVLDIGNGGGGVSWLQSTDRSDLSQSYKLLLNPNGGNVGIGTTNPINKLSVWGLSSDGTSSTGNVLEVGGPSGTNGFQAGANDAGNYAWIQTKSADNLSLNPNGGNVGIGTATPGSNKLHVYSGASGGTAYEAGGLVVESSGRSAIQLLSPNASDSYLFFGDATAGNKAYIGHNGSAMSPANLMMFYSAGNFSFNNGNVGIGTTGPNEKLEVNGKIALTSDVTRRALEVGAANDKLLIGGGFNTVYTNGNVGIGTTTPASSNGLLGTILNVNSSGSVNTVIVASSGAVSGGPGGGIFEARSNLSVTGDARFGQIGWSRVADVTVGQISSQMDLWINKDGTLTDAMVINKLGNVGIGTTSPNERLDVNGTNPRIYLADATAPGTTTNRLYSVSGNLTWNGINLTAGGALPVASEGATLRGNGTAWQANTSLFVKSDGNVGIGTTNPVAALDVERTSATPTIKLYSNRAGDSAVMENRILFGGSTSGSWSTPDGAGIDFHVNFPSEGVNGQLRFWTYPLTTGASPAMTINGGNVGIGTTGPTYHLQVESTANNQLQVTGQGAGYGGTLLANIYSERTTSGAVGLLKVGSAYAPSALYVETSGNVGIGTTGPGSKLEINGGTQTVPFRITNSNWAVGSTGTEIRTDFGATSGDTWAGWNVLKTGETAWGNLVLQSGGGNVGIGTTGPNGKLDITVADATQDSLRLGTTFVNGGNWGISPFISGVSNDGLSIIDRNTNTTRMVIQQAGNVGIGNTAPGALLTLGTAGTKAGVLSLAGSAGGTTTIAVPTTAGAYTLTLPPNGGTNGYVLSTNGSGTTSWTAVSNSSSLSALTAATVGNTINNADYAQEWQWNSLSSNSALKLSSTSTAAASNSQTMLEIALSGINVTSTQSTYGMKISNTHTGTSSTNVGLYTTASGASNNIGLNVDAGQTLLGGTTLITEPTYPQSLAKLNIVATNSSNGSQSAVAGIHGSYTFTNGGNANYVQVGDRFVVTNNPTTNPNTAVGEMIRVVDGSGLSNLVRGMDITANAGGNTAGTNTGLRSVGATFGVQGITSALAGGQAIPAAIYGESTGTTQGDVMRLYSQTMTSATSFATFYHDTSSYSGTGLLMDFAVGSGTFSGNFIDLQNNNASVFKVSSTGVTSTGLSGTVSTNAVCSSLANGTAPTANVAYELRDCSGAPSADYAEMYPVEDGIVYGDIVAMGTEIVETYDIGANGGIDWTTVKGNISKLVKSKDAYQENVIGIVSDNHGDFSSTGYNIKEVDHPMPVALNGRVPVKISASSSPIKVGDYITTSSIDAGQGMRALKSGFVIGKALEDWTPESGKLGIMVFVEQGYYESESAHEFASQVTFGGLTYFNASVEFAKSVKFKDQVEFDVPPLFNNDTAGFAVIKAGAQKVDVIFDKAYIAQPVVSANIAMEDTDTTNMTDEEATALFGEGIQSVVTNKTKDKFTIRINKVATKDIRFSWIALAVKNPKIFESIIPGLVISAPVLAPASGIAEVPVETQTASVVPPTDTSTTVVAPSEVAPTDISTTVVAPTEVVTPTETPVVETTPVVPAPVVETTPVVDPTPVPEVVATQ